MKISIIGAGWVGCHLADRLRSEHEVALYDAAGIFSGTSMANQNRLHLGFHYARNSQTRQLCKSTFEMFKRDYVEVLAEVENNVYAVPDSDSLLDFTTYMSIFDHEGYEYETCHVPELVGVEGSIRVPEMRIDACKARSMFESRLSHLLRVEKIDDGSLSGLRLSSDLVINCTNNCFRSIGSGSFFELAAMLSYVRRRKTSFGALTLVDGSLFSVFPSFDGSYTLSSVRHTPVGRLERFDQVEEARRSVREQSLRREFEGLVLSYYPDFLGDFEYMGLSTSLKSKFKSESSNRNPVTSADGNMLSCYTGKIQGIYQIEEWVRGMM